MQHMNTIAFWQRLGNMGDVFEVNNLDLQELNQKTVPEYLVMNFRQAHCIHHQMTLLSELGKCLMVNGWLVSESWEALRELLSFFWCWSISQSISVQRCREQKQKWPGPYRGVEKSNSFYCKPWVTSAHSAGLLPRSNAPYFRPFVPPRLVLLGPNEIPGQPSYSIRLLLQKEEILSD